MTVGPLHIVWFKRDLRLTDHAPLCAAATAAAGGGAVLPLYIAEPSLWQQSDAAARQWLALREALADLRDGLSALGQPLVVRIAEVIPLLERIRSTLGITALYSHEETGTLHTYRRDIAVAGWCRSHGIVWHEYRQTGCIRRLRSRDGWAARWHSFMQAPLVPPPAALPPLPQIPPGPLPLPADLGLPPDPCPNRQPNGRRIALDLLDSFLTRRGRPYRHALSSPLTAAEACSRLSVALATGSLSMREVWHATAARLSATDDPRWRASLTAFAARLHWHCHFIQKLEDAPDLETVPLHPACSRLDRTDDPARLAAFAAGETGWPFVDACLRALAATGWINFRMRAMLAAVGTYHFWQPWQSIGAILARRFTDYEPGIHWPQMQMQSGVTGINTLRVYNPVKQGYDQDPHGHFIRRWLPELADVPAPFLHEPWRWPDSRRLLDSRYPAPLTDHQNASRLARDRIAALRRTPDFAEAADQIQSRHGSRRSGLPPTTRPARTEQPAAQLRLL